MSSDWMRPYLKFDPDSFKWGSEDILLTIVYSIRSPNSVLHRVRQLEDMTREYYENLVWLLVAQMDSEYAGAYGYMPVTCISPLVAARELESVSRIVHEEIKHGDRIRDVLNSIGFDADQWVEDHWEQYDWRLEEGEKLPRERPTKDFRLNIFYYPLVSRNPRFGIDMNNLLTLINFGVFQLDQDRGAGEQLRDTLDSSFAPWASANRRTMSEENFHIDHGDKWLAKLFEEHPDLVQKQFDLWWPRVIATFGRPDSERNDLWRKFGLKHRTNEEVLRAYLDREEHPVGLQLAARIIGLEMPPTEKVLEYWKSGEYLKYI